MCLAAGFLLSFALAFLATGAVAYANSNNFHTVSGFPHGHYSYYVGPPNWRTHAESVASLVAWQHAGVDLGDPGTCHVTWSYIQHTHCDAYGNPSGKRSHHWWDSDGSAPYSQDHYMGP